MKQREFVLGFKRERERKSQRTFEMERMRSVRKVGFIYRIDKGFRGILEVCEMVIVRIPICELP